MVPGPSEGAGAPPDHLHQLRGSLPTTRCLGHRRRPGSRRRRAQRAHGWHPLRGGGQAGIGRHRLRQQGRRSGRVDPGHVRSDVRFGRVLDQAERDLRAGAHPVRVPPDPGQQPHREEGQGAPHSDSDRGRGRASRPARRPGRLPRPARGGAAGPRRAGYRRARAQAAGRQGNAASRGREDAVSAC